MTAIENKTGSFLVSKSASASYARYVYTDSWIREALAVDWTIYVYVGVLQH